MPSIKIAMVSSLAHVATILAAPSHLRGANSTAGNKLTSSSTSSIPCDCWNGGCTDRHCSSVNDIFKMVDWNRDGAGQGGVLLHMIGNADDVNGLLDAGPIEWWNAQSFGGKWPIINDCMDKTGVSDPPPCSAHAILRSDLLPIAFNYPYSIESMHPVGLLYDPMTLREDFAITDMYVLDGDTVNNPRRAHADCNLNSGHDWSSNYDGSDNAYDTHFIHYAMEHQCAFSPESETNWAGFWGNFIDARKNVLQSTYAGDTSALPDQGQSYLEPEIDVWIKDEAAWESMYNKALKAVVAQTNLCNQQLRDDKVADYCNGDEGTVIENAKHAACRVALQVKHDTGNDIPVIEASLMSNSMVVHAAWDSFTKDNEYVVPANSYMQYYDCCWLLNDGNVYNLDPNWYDDQCCYDNNGGFWKNCDYCENCNPK